MSRAEKLLQRIRNNREGRARDKKRDEERGARRATVNAAYDRTMMGFWCDECEKDFETVGEKHIAHGLNLNTGKSYECTPLRAFYLGRCPQGHVARRFITDKHDDPYYYKSEMLRRQRVDLADAMLQPHDPRFRHVYPAQWKKIQAEQEMQREMRDKGLMPSPFI